jgi:ribosomal protein S18 acetylase RimI-like enzyme
MVEDEAAVPADPPARVPEGVVVRPARPDDAASYLEMWRGVVAERRYVRTETVRFGARHFRKQFRDSLTSDHGKFVAVARGRVVGAIMIERMSHPVNRHVATLGMAVESSWRGRGVGSALMVAAMQWARNWGVEKVTLEVYPSNDRAVALYRRFGFVEEGKLARQSRKSYGYEDELIMSRWMD